MEKRHGVFVREATGIVRAISARDAFVIVTLIINYGVSFYLTFSIIPQVLPGASIAGAFIGVIPWVIALAFLYSWFTEAMPRSGGDYVWLSRVIHPAIALGLGFIFVFFQSIVVGSYAALFVTPVLSGGLGQLALLSGNSGLLNLATYFTSSDSILIVGSVIMLVTAILLSISLKVYLRIQFALWILGMIGVIIFVGILLASTRTQMISTFNTYYAPYNVTYTGVISAANAAGFSNPGLVTFGTGTVFAIFWAFFAINGFQFTGYVGGELKTPRRTMRYSAVVGGVVGCLVMAFTGYLSQNLVGAEFWNAVSYISAAGTYSVPFAFNPFYMAILLSNNVIVGAIMVISLLAWTFMLITAIGLVCSRIMLAWGFDRSVPATLSYVNNRTHTPLLAVVIYCLIAELGLVATVYAGVVFTVLNFGLMLVILFTVVGFAAVIFPYRRKSMFDKSTLSKTKIGGIPAISVLGAIVMVLYGFLVYVALAYPSLVGPISSLPLELLVLVFVLGVVAYFVTKAYYKSKDIDIGLAFSEIPPE